MMYERLSKINIWNNLKLCTIVLIYIHTHPPCVCVGEGINYFTLTDGLECKVPLPYFHNKNTMANFKNSFSVSVVCYPVSSLFLSSIFLCPADM